MSEPTYDVVENLAALLPEIPAESIVSRKVYSDDLLKVTLFGFAAREALTEHTAASPQLNHLKVTPRSFAKIWTTFESFCLTIYGVTHGTFFAYLCQ